jgi:hypothetical protein
MDRQPSIDAEVYRKEDTARLEDMYLKLQPGISNGDPRYIDAGVRVLAHKAKLNGYAAEPDQVGQASRFQININLGETPVEPQQDAIETSSSTHIDDTGDE